METLMAVVSKFNVDPVQVFVWSLHYAEIRISTKRTEQWFLNCCIKEDKKFVLNEIPICVENYCLDLLTGRATIPKGKDEGPKK
jgi:hypothetical protein